MKKFILGILLCLALSVSSAKAQSVLVGVTGVDAFDNLSAGLTAGISVPFLKHYEFNLLDSYSPYEQHVGLGTGHANYAVANGIAFFKPRVGVEASLISSGYSVTQVSKTSEYGKAGLVVRTYVFGIPSRLNFGYSGQLNNAIIGGVEASQLRGGYFTLDTRIVCSNTACLRLQENFQFGRVLEQGNPVCDGTFGNGSQAGFGPCPRKSAFGGGVSLNLLIDFHRSSDGNKLY